MFIKLEDVCFEFTLVRMDFFTTFRILMIWTVILLSFSFSEFSEIEESTDMKQCSSHICAQGSFG